MNVKGIGEKNFLKLKPMVTVRNAVTLVNLATNGALVHSRRPCGQGRPFTSKSGAAHASFASRGGCCAAVSPSSARTACCTSAR
jgi:hypothetical protein